jgi:RNA polymerase sigma-70 factor (ECF subfamily)
LNFKEKLAKEKSFNLQWKAWMVSTQAGDTQAYNALLTAISVPLKAFIFNRTRFGIDRSEGEDILQTILLKIHLSRHTYSAAYPFEPWMYEIARNVIYDFFSRIKKSEILTDNEKTFERGEESGADAMLELRRAVSALTDDQRRVITLLKLNGYTIEEAAKEMGVTVAALKVRAHRAYHALSSQLGSTSTEEEK